MVKDFKKWFMMSNLMYSCSLQPEEIAIHKRFGNADMYFERPGVLLNNLKLLSGNAIAAT